MRFSRVFFLVLFSITVSQAQTTYQSVYNILNSSTCGSGNTNCHNPAAPSGLDFSQSMTDLYQDLILTSPSNVVSQQRGDKIVYPGNPYRSLLFRKINDDLAQNVDLLPGEGDMMPPTSSLDERQAELIRQWIVWGAPDTSTVVEISTIDDYYSGLGLESVPNPPQPPGPGEGFQIRIGPFLLEPGEENANEFSGGQYMRFDAPISEEMFVNKIESNSGYGQHHYALLSTGNQQMPYGLVDASPWFFNEVKFLSSSQNSVDTLFLPEGSGITIDPDHPLVANVHFFNSSNLILACDYYLNIYTQHAFSGLQEIQFADIGYPDNPNDGPFLIPADGQPHTFSYSHTMPNSGETRYIWALMGHSHGATIENVVYKKNPDGSIGEMIYDAGCPDGIPCSFSNFDEEHVPTRYYDNFLEVNMEDGLFQSATYVNNYEYDLPYGPFAETAEMLVMGYYYVLDTEGITVSSEDMESTDTPVVYPNPIYYGDVRLSNLSRKYEKATLTDALGKTVATYNLNGMETMSIDAETINGKGVYLLTLENSSGTQTLKLIKL